MVNIKEVKRLLDKWQDILRLRDWDIKIKMVDTEWRKSGDVKIDSDDRKAILLINSNPKSTNLEELVVHELLHIKLWPMDQMIEKSIIREFGEDDNCPKKDFAMEHFFMTLERTVEELTKGFLAANGSKQELSFGRLRKEIEGEIGEVENIYDIVEE
ncbi:hypothetical protein [Oceanirhabdus sp. W0125-5]|uniref:hypothetical protein n=1 Tax=Oceanirhabdus sp. W0125-5 TaxID=2999116 RepID=UPI0022F30C11|nr:hypothetical protein [Oceanirhabdus sp. W0125-5]WBW98753.1 hypothetical protein OW730_08335 [Oceanirhabdus sp. W0125-5]